MFKIGDKVHEVSDDLLYDPCAQIIDINENGEIQVFWFYDEQDTLPADLTPYRKFNKFWPAEDFIPVMNETEFAENIEALKY